MGRVQDKVVFITGIGSVAEGWGNGKASAVLYAREGAKVFGIDANLRAAAITKKLIDDKGGVCEVREGDVTDLKAVESLVGECVQRFGRIDVLHNNVGIGGLGGPVVMDESTWDNIFAVNQKSMFFTCKHVLPVMAEQGSGSIINLSSIAALRWLGYPFAAYSASKAAVIAFTENIAIEYAPQHIRANSIVPGLMNTPLVKEAMKGAYEEGGFEEMLKIRHEQCPMGHMGDAWDIAYAALYLASDESKYVTGLKLIVDGGFTLRSA
jgi:NAD(P)-dependent dehydrogenase (short-subunit alcohol dehydrogenase family)